MRQLDDSIIFKSISKVSMLILSLGSSYTEFAIISIVLKKILN